MDGGAVRQPTQISLRTHAGMWAAQKGRLGFLFSRFHDIDQREFLYRLTVGFTLLLIVGGLAWTAYRAVLAIVAARVM